MLQNIFEIFAAIAPTRWLKKEPKSVGTGRALPLPEETPKFGLDETVEPLTKLLRGNEEDPDLSALSAALKGKLGLADWKHPPTMSPGVEALTRNVESCQGICTSRMDICPRYFHPPERTVHVCNMCDTLDVEMKRFGVAASATLVVTHR